MSLTALQHCDCGGVDTSVNVLHIVLSGVIMLIERKKIVSRVKTFFNVVFFLQQKLRLCGSNAVSVWLKSNGGETQ